MRKFSRATVAVELRLSRKSTVFNTKQIATSSIWLGGLDWYASCYGQGMATANIPVSEVMTVNPHPIMVDDTLALAAERMGTLAVHHLPVLSGRNLVGVLSAHDLALAKALGVDFDAVSVGVAMTAGPYVVAPDTALTEVARTMANRRIGSALVARGTDLQGIITIGDALCSLVDVAEGNTSPASRNSLPSRVRRRILSEHAELGKLLGAVETCAERALTEDDDVESESTSAADELRARSLELYQSLLRHMDLEDVVLVPALMEAPTYGKVRADGVLDKHKRQRAQLEMVAPFVESSDVEHLARTMLALVGAVREDMCEEEVQLLTKDALYDGLVAKDVSDG